jgi:hypothetical protein
MADLFHHVTNPSSTKIIRGETDVEVGERAAAGRPVRFPLDHPSADLALGCVRSAGRPSRVTRAGARHDCRTTERVTFPSRIRTIRCVEGSPRPYWNGWTLVQLIFIEARRARFRGLSGSPCAAARVGDPVQIIEG